MPREKTQVTSKWEGTLETIIIKVDRLQITYPVYFLWCTCIVHVVVFFNF